ncbi:M48 family metallopeptidase [Agarivorans sp. 1_MG-2023]|uniref:M48 family metallopeptidase n=1 Tax=Agarivorans sp. 1_MG-2023 TaxID=3062634 RepID=UPI0026E2DB79|nr:M48 family metallopeptidase [Agarivorans sp. 1_MG-2023]MDO6762682.1 M48 family metallopeptidase [Agarivorans sp. 1_MG-2023]
MNFKGKVFVANGSLSRAARLHCSDEGWLELSDEQGATRARFDDLEISAAIGNQPRAISFSNGDRFVADQPLELNAWLDKHGQSSLLKSFEKNFLVIAVAILVSAMVVYVSIEQGLPRLSQSLAKHIPDVVAVELEERTLEQLESVGFEPTEIDTETQQLIQGSFQQLVSGINDLHPSPQLLFYKLSDQANAFALANGSIIVTDKLVELMQQPEQLNGILLHELAHVAHNDVMAGLVRSALVSTAVVLLVGDSSLLVDGLVSAAVLGLSMGYSREAEASADLFACQWSQKLGLSEQHLLSGYQHLFEYVEADIPSWISSHPGDEERLEQLIQCSTAID